MALPPSLLIRTAKTVWTTLWRTMMGQMAPSSASGAYQRPASQFCDRIPSENFPAVPERYRLIVGMGCPWAHRTLVVRALKGLEEAVPVTVVSPSGDEGCWVFDQPDPDTSLGCRTLPQFYRQAQSGYDGRATVPLLWDSQTRRIVNNESAEIIEILNDVFNPWASHGELDLYPEDQRADIDRWNQRVYHSVNNGVYRCGFAQSQGAYDEAFQELFATLDEIDQLLASQRYLCGPALTLADVRLFTTLIRFDVVYYSLFKCNRQRIADYEHLSAYLRELYQQPGIAATCDVDAVKRDYFGNLFPLNPGGIIPQGPDLTYLEAPHGRAG